ncbi:unnamed protein product [Durusdinium trenchii]|uniref:WW domain-containing protein n=1 Tax=Durusdinium trenchii TaxID=1381693 RepID=A0ABP0IH96_9DINO
MGNSVLRRYRTQPEANNNDAWRKPKASKANAAKDKDKAPLPADGSKVAQTWLRAGVKSVATTAPSGGAHSSKSAPDKEDDDDLAEFSNLADAANKAWEKTKETAVKGKDEMNALFGLFELKDAVERSVKRVEVLQRQVENFTTKVQQHETTLDDLRRKIEATAPPHVGQWKLGDMAIRRGKGFCELSLVQLDIQPPIFEVRMSTSGSIVGTEAEKLLPLSSQQQALAKAALKEHEQAKSALLDAESNLAQAQEDSRQQHQSLTEQVEKKIKEPMSPPGLPELSQLQKQGTSDFKVPSGPAGFPTVEDLSRMQKEADRQKLDASRGSYPAPHATREVFTRPEVDKVSASDVKADKAGVTVDAKESTTKSVSRETPFVPAGMPGIPTSGSAGTASKAQTSLHQKRAQQEAFLHQQEAQLQREEAQRQQQQEAQRQREEAERQKQEEWQNRKQSKQQQQQQQSASKAPEQPQTEWVRYKTTDGQVYYHNEKTNHTSWSLPPGVTAREPTAAATGQQGTSQSQEEPFADLRRQEEENKKQREQWQQWYQQYTAWYSQQAGAGAKGDKPAGQQQQQQQEQQGSQSTYIPPKGPAPPKLDAAFEDHALYQIKSSVLKEMESMVNEGLEVAKRKKALRFLQLKWHPDKNPDKLEIAKSIFQFIEDTKPWFLHDPNAEG